MRVQDLRRAAKSEHTAHHLEANRPELHPKIHRGPITTTRTASYKGHEIVIRTTYEIAVDGSQIGGHVNVASDGRVHYHPLPNYSSGSAVELVQQIIDSFPDEFPKSARRTERRKRTGAPSSLKGRPR